MKKILSLIALVISTNLSFSQVINFEQQTPLAPNNQNTTDFNGVNLSTVNFFDYDNDNDMDLLITGKQTYFGPVTKLYNNNSFGVFTEVLNTPFQASYFGSVAIADVNNDNYSDVLISGSLNYATILYLNNGNGGFTKSSASFPGLHCGSSAFSDIDHDGDMDLFINGHDSLNHYQVYLYKNNGNGTFSLATNQPFKKTINGDCAFFDFDNDNDDDLIITGMDSNFIPITELYINNGSGTFSLSTESFIPVKYSSIAIADINNDNYKDIVIAGRSSGVNAVSILYINDSLGHLTLDSTFNCTGISDGDISLADIDGDNDKDLIINGKPGSSNYPNVSELYLNNGSGAFSLKSSCEFDTPSYGKLDLADVDNDNDLDLFITGSRYNTNISKLYTNDGSGNFQYASGSPFIGMDNGDFVFADLDNDNDQDLIINGTINTPPCNFFIDNIPVTAVYSNNGNGRFSLVSTNLFDSIYRGSVATADVNNDGKLDVMISGLDNNAYPVKYTKLYINNGNMSFTLQNNTPFDSVEHSSISFADIDGDNDQDVFISGITHNSYPYLRIAKLYKNDGSGNFSVVNNTPFIGAIGISKFTDLDNDNDLDLLIAGINNNGDKKVGYYKNDGNGNYSSDTTFSSLNKYVYDIEIADVDNDNDLDVMMATTIMQDSNINFLFINNGSGAFTLSNSFNPTVGGRAAFADVDKDGDKDVVITQYPESQVLINDGSGHFAINPTNFIKGLLWSKIKVADVDNDMDDDIFIIGTISNSKIKQSLLYINNSSAVGLSTLPSLCQKAKVYPNPAKSILNIDFKNTSKAANFILMDILGHEVIHQKLIGNHSQINISQLPKGIYLYFIEVDGIRTTSGKVIVE